MNSALRRSTAGSSRWRLEACARARSRWSRPIAFFGTGWCPIMRRGSTISGAARATGAIRSISRFVHRSLAGRVARPQPTQSPPRRSWQTPLCAMTSSPIWARRSIPASRSRTSLPANPTSSLTPRHAGSRNHRPCHSTPSTFTAALGSARPISCTRLPGISAQAIHIARWFICRRKSSCISSSARCALRP